MVDGVFANQLPRDVHAILKQLVDQPDIAEALAKAGLDRRDAVREVGRDPAVLARAAAAYEPIDNLRRRAEAHREARPSPWLAGERLPTGQRVLGTSAGVITAFVIVTIFEAGSLLPVPIGPAVSLALMIAWGAVVGPHVPPPVRDLARWYAVRLRLWLAPAAQWPRSRRELRDHVLEPELLGWIGGRLTPPFDTTIRLRDSAGLMRPAGTGPLVPTPATAACAREINRGMPAAIGVSGSRGSGKSTIVARAVGNEFTAADRAPVLGILIAAPVRYDARDFILNMHAAACRAVSDLLAAPDGGPRSESFRLWYRRARVYSFHARVWFWFRALVRIVVLLCVAAVVLVAPVGWQGGVAGSVVAIRTLVHEFGADPSGFAGGHKWQIGVLVIVAGMVSWTAVTRVLWPPLVLVWSVLWGVLGRGFRFRLSPGRAALRAVTRAHLRRIRFLQTRTTGWSGKLTPAGVELAPSRAVANAEQPLTYPEVVERFREYLRLVGDVLVSSEGISSIVVAIDELDRIADPAEAQHFLNDVKSVFGVNHCVFLVSVSEDAFSSFERRGMPVRDAFDSSFTSVIHVDPFTLAESQRWLAYRAMGIPTPFVWLCHCLSGGLPRELGRVALALHDLHRENSGLGELAAAIVDVDVQSKRRAFLHAARGLPVDEDGSRALIAYLHGSTDARAMYGNVTAMRRPLDAVVATRSERLCNEIVCYVLFCHTLLWLFTDYVDPGLGTPGDQGELSEVEVLADVRRQMGIDTAVSLRALTGFRVRSGIEPAGL
ncbi:hypothetical protein Aglo01_31400 [Actinokineospora globicatena]|nr:hypothetical protein Aglo01_31400 [Actinokineospora globicatena]GLW84674.1 hypothetical protein Aglo02_23140 [Actinokineospora globicatena]